MLDGVVCIGGFDFWDLDNWFWNFGFYYMCLDGLCQVYIKGYLFIFD